MPKVKPDRNGDATYDGIGQTVHDPLVRDLLSTPAARRTAEILISGFNFHTHPLNTHTRLDHLFGTSRRMSELIDALNSHQSRAVIEVPQIKNLLAMTATHDLGHLPFSHTLEGLVHFHEGLVHDDISALIVEGKLDYMWYRTEHPRVFFPGNPNSGSGYIASVEAWMSLQPMLTNLKSVPDILARHGIERSLVVQVLSDKIAAKLGYGHLARENRIYRQLMNGALFDVDKVDNMERDSFLARDPKFSFDFDRLFGALKVVEYPSNCMALAIREESLPSLKKCVRIRKRMFQEMYTKKDFLVYEAMLIDAVSRTYGAFKRNEIELYFLNDDDLINLLKAHGGAEVQEHLLLMDVMKGAVTFSEAFSIKAEKTEDAGGKRNLTQKKFEITRDYAMLNTVYAFIDWAKKNYPSEFPVDVIRRNIYERAYKKSPGIKEHQILVRMPYIYRAEEEWISDLEDDLLVIPVGGVSSRRPLPLKTIPQISRERGGIATSIMQIYCQPKAHNYFLVYSRGADEDIVNRAASQFIKEIPKIIGK
ncbi:hypothetical protein J4212_02590 [Candidatus Woesearchaeota archaeon]|nr:hypothetical protein [Candidatus Woesearchaeota archaeon]